MLQRVITSASSHSFFSAFNTSMFKSLLTATNSSVENTAENKVENVKSLKVIYKGENFIVVDKDYDVRINSDDPSHTLTVETQLAQLFPELVDSSLGHSFRWIHRLDHATSGLLCIALNKNAAKWGSRMFAERKAEKQYLALVRGHLPKYENNQKKIDIPIGRDSSETEIYKFCTPENVHCINPRPAQTTIIPLEHGTYNGDPATKVMLKPHTGRTHQLRIHCGHIGHLIVGDYQYSNREDNKPHRMMLHAYRLVIPMKQEYIEVQTDDPFVMTLDSLWQPEKVITNILDCISDSSL